MILSNRYLGLHGSPYNVFFRSHNLLGWLNGKSMGFLIVVVSLSIKVLLQKTLLQSPFMRRRLCSMAVLVLWRRDEYETTGGIFSFFYLYLYS